MVAARPRRARTVAPALLLTLTITGIWVVLAGRSATASPRQASADDARRTYLSECAVCHGADGGGGTRGPSLRDVGAASVDYMITTGRMPINEPTDNLRRRTPRYDAALQRALVDYVSNLSVGGPAIPQLDLDAADVSRGGELFREQCAACHAWSGTGGALLEREAPGLAAATPVQIAEAIRTGPASMPVFGSAALNDEELSDTVAFVDSLKDLDDRGGLPLGHLGPVPEGALAIVGALGLLLVASRWIGTSR